MEDFLRKREVDERIIALMEEEKIDEDVVKLMSDDELKEYLPKRGDLIALRNFLKPTAVSHTKEKKTSFMARLKERLQHPSAPLDDDEDDTGKSKTAKKQRVCNATKSHHNVDLGWLHYNDELHDFKQVRQKKGGGNRTVSVDKSCTKKDLIAEAKKLFFRKHTSFHGDEKDMIMDMTDFQCQTMDETTTVGDIINVAKITKAHFYLTTKKKKQNMLDYMSDDSLPDLLGHKTESNNQLSDDSSDATADTSFTVNLTGDDTQAIHPTNVAAGKPETSIGEDLLGRKIDTKRISSNDSSSASTDQAHTINLTGDDTQATSTTHPSNVAAGQSESAICEDLLEREIDTKHNPSNAFSSATAENSSTMILTGEETQATTSTHPTNVVAGKPESVMWEDSLGEIQFHVWTPPVHHRVPQPFEIVVHRGHAYEDLKRIFMGHPDIDMQNDMISVMCILPNGEAERADDNGGVLRDVLSEFWETFYDQCTLGSDYKVPCLRHDYDTDDWTSIAHVFALGWITQRIIPIRLAPSFINCCLYGMELRDENSACSQDALVDEFLQYVPNSEKMVLHTAYTNFDQLDDTDKEELNDILISNHDCKVLVKAENIKRTLTQIARKELVQEASFIKDAWFSTLVGYDLGIDLKKETERLKPSTKRVLSIIDCEDGSAPSLKLLQKFIRELDDVNLRAFLRFTTASDLMLSGDDGNYHRLTVRMVDLTGFARRPIAHTCGRVLELPKQYESFPQFRSEFNSILTSKVWVMDIS